MPSELRLLLAVVAVLGVTWSVLVPGWQGPDEPAHFGYAQGLAEDFRLPGDPDRRTFSTEQDNAAMASNGYQQPGAVEVKPTWSELAYGYWKDDTGSDARGDGGGPNPATDNPPLYYLLELPAYKLAGGLDLDGRLYAMRLVSVVLLLLTVLLAWAAAREAFPDEPLLQLVAAGFVGLLPMLSFISSFVTPDALLIALWTGVIWMGLRILRRGLTVRRALALCGFAGLAMVTKQTSYALLPSLLLVLGIGAWRLTPRKAVLAPALAAFVALAVPVGIWLVVAGATDRAAAGQVTDFALSGGPPVNLREFASYVWQFYLPRPGFLEQFAPLATLHTQAVWELWFKRSLGAFGWLEVRYPAWVYYVSALAAAGVVVGAVAAAIRRRNVAWAMLGFAALLTVSLVGGLHWTEYKLSVQTGGIFNQGRYLLPLVALGGLVAAQAAHVLPRRWRPLYAATLLSSLFALELLGLAIVAARYYAA